MSKEYKVSRLLISGMTNISFPGAIHQIKIKKNELLEADVDLKKRKIKCCDCLFRWTKSSIS
ncbi:hypothetical protein NW066_05440 [Mycoplasmopsis felis]|uniref:hypothetical protein n=1 Tax=Mycoplasmopsis felis TaxID=33923 RepID=UPI0021B012CC|nr:hypothetical protein [Mycoplasmopsis felis]UWV84964.1 hypothetical protein NW066_05440 [Mycoplasmopsis felis]